MARKKKNQGYIEKWAVAKVVPPPPRRTADGVTVEYSTHREPCVVCQLPAYTRIEQIPLHSDRCLDYHRKAGDMSEG